MVFETLERYESTSHRLLLSEGASLEFAWRVARTCARLPVRGLSRVELPAESGRVSVEERTLSVTRSPEGVKVQLDNNDGLIELERVGGWVAVKITEGT